MTFTPIAKGTQNWDVPLNLALFQLDAAITAGTAGSLQASNNLSDLTNVPQARSNLGLGNSAIAGATQFNVKDYGALGNGTADDLVPLQNAINAAAIVGGIVFLPPGVYRISNTLTVKTGVTLSGSHVTAWANRFPTPLCAIKPTSSFAGECAISMLGADITGSGSNEGNVRINNIELDGSALPAGSVSGIHAQGEVLDIILTHVMCKQFTHNGIHTNIGTGTRAPHDWYFDSVVCYQNAGFGFSLSMTDGYMRDCISTTNGGDGYLLGPFGSLSFEGCQALFNTGNGLTVAGGSQVGNVVISHFLTDRNGMDGIHLGTSSGIASPSIQLSNITLNRDGRNGNSGGGSFAGLRINVMANPVIINGITITPGIDDNATGVNSPQYGISLTGANAYVSVNNGYLHANTQGWIHDGSTVILRRFNVDEATGPKATPTRVIDGGVTTYERGIQSPGPSLGLPRPASHNAALAWTADPVTINGGTAPVASGTVYLSALYVPKQFTATKLFWAVTSPGLGTPVAGQNFVGLYDSAGNRLASVNVDARTGTNTMFTETISATLTPGLYWVAFVFNATTLPTIAGPAGLITAATNFNTTASNNRWAVNGVSQTSLPATITPGSNTNPTISRFYWAALA